MNEQSTDDVLARLRAADPAAGAEPDLEALRAAVHRRAGSTPAAGQATEEDVELHDELASARARRRWTAWPARVAGAAAAALLVGAGGGYAIGAAGDPTAPPPSEGVITLSGPGVGPAATEEAGGFAPRALGGAEVAATDSARTSIWPGYGGRTVFTQSGLSGEGGTARAWGYDTTGAFTQEAVVRAAQALGVAGEPTQVDQTWTVGTTDGTGPVVQLYADGTVSLSYYDPLKDPWGCDVGVGEDTASSSDDAATSELVEPSAGVGEDGVEIMPAPEPCRQRELGPAPSSEDAAAQVRDFLAALGQDPAGFEVVAEDFGDEMFTYVSAYQVVDGQRTGATWSAAFTGAGLQNLYGATAGLVDLGDYAVVSPVEAVARLTDPRFAGWGGPIAYAEGASPRESDLAAPSEPQMPGTPEPGSPVAWPVTEVTLVEARLGVAQHVEPDGTTLLVPSYELTSTDGGIWSVIAVADDALDFGAGR